jgi:hypothetical protein
LKFNDDIEFDFANSSLNHQNVIQPLIWQSCAATWRMLRGFPSLLSGGLRSMVLQWGSVGPKNEKTSVMTVLFQPLALRGVTLPNRVAVSPDGHDGPRAAGVGTLQTNTNGCWY